MYIIEAVEYWIEQYQPDAIEYRALSPYDKEQVFYKIRDKPIGVGLRFNAITISIQWHWYNYCDNKPSYFYSYDESYRYSFPYTLNAEIALLSPDGRMVEFDKGDYTDNVLGWQSAEEIEAIIQVLVDYKDS